MKNQALSKQTCPPISVEPIGLVHSPYREHGDVAHTDRGWTDDEALIQLLPEHAHGLNGLTGYSHVIVLFYIHRADEWRMPKEHHKPPDVQVFATRMPRRPVPIGLSVVELVHFNPSTGRVHVHGLDALDGTPVLDIKPYIRQFDSFHEATLPPWLEEHLNQYHHHHGLNREDQDPAD